MKFLKKLTALISICVLSIALSGCSSKSLSVDGYYWFADPSGFPYPFTETLVYNVTVENTTMSNSTAVSNEQVTLEITSGSYVTTLKTAENNTYGKYYRYETKLSLSGKYVVAGEPKEFTDRYETVTLLRRDLSPISTEKRCSNSTLFTSNDKGAGILSYKYDYNIAYTDKVASVTITEYDKNNVPSVIERTFKDYTKGAFVDNDALLLVPRAYGYASRFSKEFNCIDVLSNKNHELTLYTYGSDKIDVKNLPNYTLNGVLGTETVACNHARIAINSVYSGPAIECYYAVDKQTHRQRLLRVYNKINDNIGYLCYSLTSATVTA